MPAWRESAEILSRFVDSLFEFFVQKSDQFSISTYRLTAHTERFPKTNHRIRLLRSAAKKAS